MDPSIIHRAELHAALADPIRLSIVDDLSATDRSPKELSDRLELPTNLVAHHLDVLERSGLIDRFVSDGDKRRRYVRLRGAPLRDLGFALAEPAPTVLFVCTHNSARSQLASALWRARVGDTATSAGTHPADRVHPGAVAAAARIGLDLSGATPAMLAGTPSADLVVTVCDRAHEELTPGPDWWHWSIPDPSEDGSDDAFDAVVADLETRIAMVQP